MNYTGKAKIPDKWRERFFATAKLYASWSKDPSRKIGAVAIDPVKRTILSAGYNGFPRGIEDTHERLNNRSEKYKYVVHAEMNVIYNATFNGVSLDGSTLYVYGLPVCSECAKGIIQVGIKKIHIFTDQDIPETWSESWKKTHEMFDEVGIEHDWEHRI